MKKQCDTCGDWVVVENDDFSKHNQMNFVRHVFISHSRDEERIFILQNALDRAKEARFE